MPKDINLFFNFNVSSFSTNFILNIKFLHFSSKSLIISDFLANFIFVMYSSISSFIFLFSSKDKKYSLTLNGIAKLWGYFNQSQSGTFPRIFLVFKDFAPTHFFSNSSISKNIFLYFWPISSIVIFLFVIIFSSFFSLVLIILFFVKMNSWLLIFKLTFCHNNLIISFAIFSLKHTAKGTFKFLARTDTWAKTSG